MWNQQQYEDGLTAIRDLSTDVETATAEIEHVTERMRNGEHYFNVVPADGNGTEEVHAVGIAIADDEVNRGYVFSREDTEEDTFSMIAFEYEDHGLSSTRLGDGYMRCVDADAGVEYPDDAIPNNLGTVYGRADLYHDLLSTAENGKAPEDVQVLLDGYQPTM